MEAAYLALGPKDVSGVGWSVPLHFLLPLASSSSACFYFLKIVIVTLNFYVQVAAADARMGIKWLLLIRESFMGIKTLPDFLLQIRLEPSWLVHTEALGLVGHCEHDVNNTEQEQREVRGLVQLYSEGMRSYLFWSSFLTWTWLTYTLVNCHRKHPVLQRSNHLIALQKSEPITNFVQISCNL